MLLRTKIGEKMDKLEWKIPVEIIMGKNSYPISSFSGTVEEPEYFREPTKQEMVEKINEIIEWLNSQKLS